MLPAHSLETHLDLTRGHVDTPHIPQYFLLLLCHKPGCLHALIKGRQPSHELLNALPLQLLRNQALNRKCVCPSDRQSSQPCEEEEFPRELNPLKSSLGSGSVKPFSLAIFTTSEKLGVVCPVEREGENSPKIKAIVPLSTPSILRISSPVARSSRTVKTMGNPAPMATWRHPPWGFRDLVRERVRAIGRKLFCRGR